MWFLERLDKSKSGYDLCIISENDVKKNSGKFLWPVKKRTP